MGEIYDEDEAEELADDSQTIFTDSHSGIVTIQGHANLDDVCSALNLHLDDEIKAEFSTISGFLCAHAKVIPKPQDVIRLAPYDFTVIEVEDNRRIRSLIAQHRPTRTGDEVDEQNDEDMADETSNKSIVDISDLRMGAVIDNGPSSNPGTPMTN